MNDKIKLILLSVLVIISCITMYFKTNQNKINDAIKFKNEYETLNNKENNHGKKYLNLNIDTNNNIKYASFKEIENILTQENGVIYFGFPECPWCRNIIEPLLKASEETELSKIYYFNAYEIRDQKQLNENNEIITKKEGTEEYKKLIEIMYDELGEYEGLNNKTIKRLYFPTIVFVKDGKIINTHIGTIDEQEDPYTPLTQKQKDTLKNIYKTYMLEIKDTKCTDKC